MVAYYSKLCDGKSRPIERKKSKISFPHFQFVLLWMVDNALVTQLLTVLVFNLKRLFLAPSDSSSYLKIS